MGIIKSNYFKHSLIIPICKWQEIGVVSSLKCQRGYRQALPRGIVMWG